MMGKQTWFMICMLTAAVVTQFVEEGKSFAYSCIVEKSFLFSVCFFLLMALAKSNLDLTQFFKGNWNAPRTKNRYRVIEVSVF